MEKKFLVAVGAICVGVAGLLMLSMMSAGLWFCCDDSIAETFNYPPIGQLDLLTVWPATMFLAHIFGGTKSASKSKND